MPRSPAAGSGATACGYFSAAGDLTTTTECTPIRRSRSTLDESGKACATSRTACWSLGVKPLIPLTTLGNFAVDHSIGKKSYFVSVGSTRIGPEAAANPAGAGGTV